MYETKDDLPVRHRILIFGLVDYMTAFPPVSLYVGAPHPAACTTVSWAGKITSRGVI
ncbi:hypothetical protein FAIPA1_600006 [Frankia sp. AiPs1]